MLITFLKFIKLWFYLNHSKQNFLRQATAIPNSDKNNKPYMMQCHQLKVKHLDLHFHRWKCAFSALMLLAEWQEWHPACKNWVVRNWHGYLSGARCKWFAYGSADATTTPSSLAPVKSRMVYLSGAGLPSLPWKKRSLNGCSSTEENAFYLTLLVLKWLCMASSILMEMVVACLHTTFWDSKDNIKFCKWANLYKTMQSD